MAIPCSGSAKAGKLRNNRAMRPRRTDLNDTVPSPFENAICRLLVAADWLIRHLIKMLALNGAWL
jgi:hypothetical protein